jgi:hypothetical protein
MLPLLLATSAGIAVVVVASLESMKSMVKSYVKASFSGSVVRDAST